MQIDRRFTRPTDGPFAALNFVPRASRIVNPNGTVVFEAKDILVPESWSQVAVDILAQKYFRRAGVPARTVRVAEEGVPEWLQSSRPESSDTPLVGETDSRQVFHRLAGCWTYWGLKGKYFTTEGDARAFYDEVCHMLAAQMAAPNSPQWFNTGLHWAYGIEGPPQGHYFVDPRTDELTRATSAYERPAPHACFIQGVCDDLVNDGGIMDLWVREARIFKYGSGTGSNFSALRGDGEPLSGGGKSSGLMSFLKIGDRAAGAIKSGGTTRRAAKMVVLDLDHPDIEEFVNWKVIEEQKVAALVGGSRLLNKHMNAVLRAVVGHADAGGQYDPAKNAALKGAVLAARTALVPENYIARAMQLAKQGFTSLDIEEYDTDWTSKAYYTVSGQNSNNTVSITNRFMDAVEADGPWQLYWRTELEKSKAQGRAAKPSKTLKARELWDQIAYAAWACADPGVQFHTTINEWHTCPADGPIRASNPCCVTGDTLVAVADGRDPQPIRDLAGTEVPVYAWDHKRKCGTVGRMWNVGVKRKDARVFKVALDDGSAFRATDDHPGHAARRHLPDGARSSRGRLGESVPLRKRHRRVARRLPRARRRRDRHAPRTGDPVLCGVPLQFHRRGGAGVLLGRVPEQPRRRGNARRLGDRELP